MMAVWQHTPNSIKANVLAVAIPRMLSGAPVILQSSYDPRCRHNLLDQIVFFQFVEQIGFRERLRNEGRYSRVDGLHHRVSRPIRRDNDDRAGKS
jgi:hypothetical protein